MNGIDYTLALMEQGRSDEEIERLAAVSLLQVLELRADRAAAAWRKPLKSRRSVSVCAPRVEPSPTDDRGPCGPA